MPRLTWRVVRTVAEELRQLDPKKRFMTLSAVYVCDGARLSLLASSDEAPGWEDVVSEAIEAAEALGL